MPKKQPLKKFAILLITIGAVSLFFTAKELIKRNTPVDFSVTNNIPYSYKDKTVPTEIEFVQLGLKLPVSVKNISNGKWEDPEATVAYWSESPLPGKMGNSVMYGHNWTNLLGKLPKTKKLDQISVKFNDGTYRKFIVESTYIVTADQKHILNPSDDARLTIYTCTGFLDSKRFVVVAIPVI